MTLRNVSRSGVSVNRRGFGLCAAFVGAESIFLQYIREKEFLREIILTCLSGAHTVEPRTVILRN